VAGGILANIYISSHSVDVMPVLQRLSTDSYNWGSSEDRSLACLTYFSYLLTTCQFFNFSIFFKKKYAKDKSSTDFTLSVLYLLQSINNVIASWTMTMIYLPTYRIAPVSFSLSFASHPQFQLNQNYQKKEELTDMVCLTVTDTHID